MNRKELQKELASIDAQIAELQLRRDELPKQSEEYAAYLQRERDRAIPFPMSIEMFWKMSDNLIRPASPAHRRSLMTQLAIPVPKDEDSQ